MADLALAPTTKTRKRIDYVLAAAYIAGGMTYKEAAAKLGCTVGSLHVGMSTKGLTKAAREANLQLREMTSPSNVLKAASDILRNDLSNELQKTTQALSKISVKGGLRKLKQRMDVIEPLARAGKTVHSWEAEDKPGMVERTSLKADIIDIQAQPLQLHNGAMCTPNDVSTCKADDNDYSI